MRTNSTNPRQLTAAERRLAVLDMKRKYLSFDEIGKRLGMSKQAAHKAYKKALAELGKQQTALATELLTRELDVLEGLRAKTAAIMDDERADPKDRLTAIKLLTDNVVTVCKMTGIAAPISIETKNTNLDLSADQFERMAALLANESAAPNGDGTGSKEEGQ